MNESQNIVASWRLYRGRIERLERRNAELEKRTVHQAHQIVLALHELAVAKGKEPQYFIRRWLREHREESGGEAPDEA